MDDLEKEIKNALLLSSVPALRLAFLIEKVDGITRHSEDVKTFVRWSEYKLKLHEKVFHDVGREQNELAAVSIRYEIAKRLNQLSDCDSHYVKDLLGWTRSLLTNHDLANVLEVNREWNKQDNSRVRKLFRIRSSLNLIEKMPEIVKCLSQDERDLLGQWISVSGTLLHPSAIKQ
jgi:hypothetical protein